MSELTICKIILVGIMIYFCDGCTVTKPITLRSELRGPLATGPVTLLTKDSSLYKLTNYKLLDSSVVGSGSVRKKGIAQEFSGELRLSDICYIQAQSSSFWKGLLTTAFAGSFVGLASGGLGGEDGLSVRERILYPPGKSCPFIYSWDGKKYRMEGEAFGIGLGKALEATTCTVLNSLTEDQGQLSVRLTNERSETHHFNIVNLFAVESDLNAEVYSDAAGILWPVYAQIPPMSSVDNSGKNITAQILHRDGNYWESDLSMAGILSGFQDEIDLVFIKPKRAEEGSIVIHAMNTHFSEAVFNNVFSFLGDESFAFMNAVEHDSAMIRILKEWLEESSLKVSILKGSTWETIGVIRPEADSVQFSKLVRLKDARQLPDTVRVRISSLTDVWKIDAVAIDWTPMTALKQTRVAMLSAVGPRGEDLRRELGSSDDKYAVLLPPDKIDLKFKSSTPIPGKKVTYAIYVGGYLHEWPSDVASHALKLLAPMMNEEAKIPYLKVLLQNKSILLPPLYAEWGRFRNEHSKVTR